MADIVARMDCGLGGIRRLKTRHIMSEGTKFNFFHEVNIEPQHHCTYLYWYKDDGAALGCGFTRSGLTIVSTLR